MKICSFYYKKPKGAHNIFGWGTWIRTKEISESEADALPLGYTPRIRRGLPRYRF